MRFNVLSYFYIKNCIICYHRGKGLKWIALARPGFWQQGGHKDSSCEKLLEASTMSGKANP